MLVPNRNADSKEYRYGFQGQEKDDELKGGDGNSDNFKHRMNDPRIGRFFARDPLAEQTPNWSPYAFCNNNPLFFADPTGMSVEPPVNGLEYFRDNTGEYFWDNKKSSYEHYGDPKKTGSNTFQGYYSANEFSEPKGNYTIIFDLSSSKPKDEFDRSKTITELSDPLYSYLNVRGELSGGEIKNISDPDKYPGVEIYSSPYMNGALTAGNVIFTNPGMQDAETLDHEYGHYLDYKYHFKYDKGQYAKTIALPSFISATSATIAPSLHDHETSESEKRANRLGGAWTGNSSLKNKLRN